MAVALEEKENVAWSTTAFDIPGLDLHPSDAKYDGWGKKNTRVIYEYCKANGKSCPAVEYAYEYKTAGTSAGDWHLPSYVEFDYISTNTSTINDTIKKINKKPLYDYSNYHGNMQQHVYNVYYWTSTAIDKQNVYTFGGDYYGDRRIIEKTLINHTDTGSSIYDGFTGYYHYVYISRPVIAF